ncbi:MAG: hypothetical protein EBU88_07660 [Acidobacteria bacterium]|nr:hypothetical protein [Acidobacteriota bacterium]
MTAWLREVMKREVKFKRERRLMCLMGLEAIYPNLRLSIAALSQQGYPCLRRGLKIDRVNQIWSTDVTYIRLQASFIYLVKIINWHTYYVLSWRISS